MHSWIRKERMVDETIDMLAFKHLQASVRSRTGFLHLMIRLMDGWHRCVLVMIEHAC